MYSESPRTDVGHERRREVRNTLVNQFVNELLVRIKAGIISTPSQVIEFDAMFRQEHRETGADFSPEQATYEAFMRMRAVSKVYPTSNAELKKSEPSIETAYKLLYAAESFRKIAKASQIPGE